MCSSKRSADLALRAALNLLVQITDLLSAQTFPNRPERLAGLRRDFRRAWDTRVVNYITEYVNRRLDDLEDTYDPLTGGGALQQVALDVTNSAASLRARIPNEIHL